MNENDTYIREAEIAEEGAATALSRRVLGALLLVSLVVNFANVLGRYLLSASLIWAEEFMVFAMAWIVFPAGAVLVWQGRHLAMDLISDRLGGRWKRLADAGSALATLVLCGFAAIQSWAYVRQVAGQGQASVAAGIPMTVPHAALLTGFGLMACFAAFRLATVLRHRGGGARP